MTLPTINIKQTVKIADSVPTNVQQSVIIDSVRGGTVYQGPFTLSGADAISGPAAAFELEAGFILLPGLLYKVVEANSGGVGYTILDALPTPGVPASGYLDLVFGDSSSTGFRLDTNGVSIYSDPRTFYLAIKADNGVVNGPWPQATDLSAWSANDYAIIGSNPATQGNRIWILTSAGTTGNTEPDWLANEGMGPIVDGTCEWTEGGSWAANGEISFYPYVVKVPV